MPIDCTRCPLRKHALFAPFEGDEVEFMARFKKGELRVEPGTTILLEGTRSPQLYTVLDGMGTRSTMLENGRRQVINFLFPGDFIGLQGGLMVESSYSVEAATPMTLCVFQRGDLWTLFRQHPPRAYDLTWIAAVGEHFLGETVATLGQRDATQRVAWALVRLFERLRAVGLEEDGKVPMPFRQQDLADALGLSLVHTNKTLKALRSKGLATWRDGTLHMREPKLLAEVAMIDLERPETRPLI